MALLSSNGEGSLSDGLSLPETFVLHQNYPNPFNPTTIIKYNLPELSDVKLEVFNVLGQKVMTLVDGMKEPGYKQAIWKGDSINGAYVASGVYIYRLQATGKETGTSFSKCKKMILLR